MGPRQTDLALYRERPNRIASPFVRFDNQAMHALIIAAALLAQLPDPPKDNAALIAKQEQIVVDQRNYLAKIIKAPVDTTRPSTAPRGRGSVVSGFNVGSGMSSLRFHSHKEKGQYYLEAKGKLDAAERQLKLLRGDDPFSDKRPIVTKKQAAVKPRR